MYNKTKGKNMRKINDVKDDLIKNLNEFKECEGFKPEELGIFLASMLTYVNMDTYKVKDMAQDMYDYQHRQLHPFKTKIFDLFYAADQFNQAKLKLTFPYEGRCFELYGRESVYILEMIINEKV